MGHNLLFKYYDKFVREFLPRLNGFSNSLQRMSLADKGLARQRALNGVNELRRLWGPSPDHYNWAHEIAVDVIALWTCGPAYLAAFQDVLERPGTDPYQIGQSHPPYEVRASALIAASDRLNWASLTGDLRRQIDDWRVSGRWGGRTNTYLSYAIPDLTIACVEAAITTCESLGLPLCTPPILRDLGDKLARGYVPDFGPELLLAAWLLRSRMGEAEYMAWEEVTVRSLHDTVTQ